MTTMLDHRLSDEEWETMLKSACQERHAKNSEYVNVMHILKYM